jgi:iron(III) transport system permease protein
MAPHTQSGLIAAWIISFIFCMRELGATLLIVPPGKATLSVRIYSLMHYGAGNLVAALCIILIVISLVPVVLAFRF